MMIYGFKKSFKDCFYCSEPHKHVCVFVQVPYFHITVAESFMY